MSILEARSIEKSFVEGKEPVPVLRGIDFAAEEGDSDLGHLVHALVDEGKLVAAAAEVELHDDPWQMNVLATKRGSAHHPSMLEDVEARRPTEVELINGALVREALRHGVDAPLQNAVYRLVVAKEASYS